MTGSVKEGTMESDTAFDFHIAAHCLGTSHTEKDLRDYLFVPAAAVPVLPSSGVEAVTCA